MRLFATVIKGPDGTLRVEGLSDEAPGAAESAFAKSVADGKDQAAFMLWHPRETKRAKPAEDAVRVREMANRIGAELPKPESAETKKPAPSRK